MLRRDMNIPWYIYARKHSLSDGNKKGKEKRSNSCAWQDIGLHDEKENLSLLV